MADAILALTANQAMATNQRIEFKPEWFDQASDEVPEPDETCSMANVKSQLDQA